MRAMWRSGGSQIEEWLPDPVPPEIRILNLEWIILNKELLDLNFLIDFRIVLRQMKRPIRWNETKHTRLLQSIAGRAIWILPFIPIKYTSKQNLFTCFIVFIKTSFARLCFYFLSQSLFVSLALYPSIVCSCWWTIAKDTWRISLLCGPLDGFYGRLSSRWILNISLPSMKSWQ